MASPILVQALSADLGHLEEMLSEAKTSAKSLLILKEPAIVLAALSDLEEALQAMREDSLRGIVRVSLAVGQIKGGRR